MLGKRGKVDERPAVTTLKAIASDKIALSRKEMKLHQRGISTLSLERKSDLEKGSRFFFFSSPQPNASDPSNSWRWGE